MVVSLKQREINKDKIEPQRTHPTREAKIYDNNDFNIFCRQMGSGMSYSIEDAKSRYNVND